MFRNFFKLGIYQIRRMSRQPIDAPTQPTTRIINILSNVATTVIVYRQISSINKKLEKGFEKISSINKKLEKGFEDLKA